MTVTEAMDRINDIRNRTENRDDRLALEMAYESLRKEPNHIGAFKVIDKKTGKEADVEKIALKEEWAQHLIYCDMDGFLIGEDGSLYLADECSHWAYAPPDRFEVVPI